MSGVVAALISLSVTCVSGLGEEVPSPRSLVRSIRQAIAPIEDVTFEWTTVGVFIRGPHKGRSETRKGRMFFRVADLSLRAECTVTHNAGIRSRPTRLRRAPPSQARSEWALRRV